MSALIHELQRRELQEKGYTVLQNLFTPAEMAELASQIEDHQRRHVENLKAMGGTDGGISRAEEITFTDHLAENDANIMKFVKRAEFVDITTALLGPDTDLYWNQSVYKAGHGTKQFSMASGRRVHERRPEPLSNHLARRE